MDNPVIKLLGQTLKAPRPDTPISKAVARKLGLDTPTGMTAFLSSFRSSTDNTGEGANLPMIGRIEFLSKLENANSKE